MKAKLSPFLLLVLLTGFLMSCSQERAMVEREHTYKYKKVYVGNRIIYRENIERAPVKGFVDINKAEQVKTESALRLPPDIQEPINVSKEETKTTSSRNWFSRVSHSGSRQLIEYGEKQEASRQEIGNGEASTDATNVSTGGIFAIIGFILGLAGILGGGLGIGLAIAGIIFSALGLNSEYRTLALIGLILTGIILVIVILAL